MMFRQFSVTIRPKTDQSTRQIDHFLARITPFGWFLSTDPH